MSEWLHFSGPGRNFSLSCVFPRKADRGLQEDLQGFSSIALPKPGFVLDALSGPYFISRGTFQIKALQSGLLCVPQFIVNAS